MSESEEKSFHRRAIQNAEQTSETGHPWSTLATVSTFDRGINMKSTLCVGSEKQRQVTHQVTPTTSILIVSLIQQLCTMLEGDKKLKNKLYEAFCDKLHELDLIDSSYNMIEFEALRGQYQRILYHLVSIARNEIRDGSTLQIPSYLIPEWSYYDQKFHEIGFIASGGFGKVFKARHRLDGTDYAIKKLVVHCSRVEMIMQHLREVKTLAKLNHANIVPYKAAWIESAPFSFVTSTPVKQSESQKTSNESDSDNLLSNLCGDVSSQNLTCDDDKEDMVLNNKAKYTTGQQIDEEDPPEKYIKDISSDIVSFRNSQDSKSEDQTENEVISSSQDSNEESDNQREVCTYKASGKQKYMTLYIQMALCEQTLQQWMDNRINATPEQMVTEVFQQILCGLDYIHSRGIIHHDIKPSNIFISTSGQLQIYLGDFGLACPLQADSHHPVLGTRTYAAPEQLQGKCDPKSDIYSVGIVLTELLIQMQTQMELSHLIVSLKRGDVPEAFAEQQKWAQLIMQLIQEDPTKRPCTKLLLNILNVDKNMKIAQLRDDLRDKDNIIQDQNNMIQELRNEVTVLKEELKKLKILEET